MNLDNFPNYEIIKILFISYQLVMAMRKSTSQINKMPNEENRKAEEVGP